MSDESRFRIAFTNAFKKDVKTAKKRGRNLDELFTVVAQLAAGTVLPQHNRNHALGGNWRGTRECHIKPEHYAVKVKDSGVSFKLMSVVARSPRAASASWATVVPPTAAGGA